MRRPFEDGGASLAPPGRSPRARVAAATAVRVVRQRCDALAVAVGLPERARTGAVLAPLAAATDDSVAAAVVGNVPPVGWARGAIGGGGPTLSVRSRSLAVLSCRRSNGRAATARIYGANHAMDSRIGCGHSDPNQGKGFGQAASMRHVVVTPPFVVHRSRAASRSWAKNARRPRWDAKRMDVPEARCSTRPVNRRPRSLVVLKCTTNARCGGNVAAGS